MTPIFLLFFCTHFPVANYMLIGFQQPECAVLKRGDKVRGKEGEIAGSPRRRKGKVMMDGDIFKPNYSDRIHKNLL